MAELGHGTPARTTPRLRDGEPIPEAIMPAGLERLYRRPRVRRLLARHFNRAYYYALETTLGTTHWLGTTVLKYPTDLWSYQEIVTETRPDLIVETGTWRGGSALYLAHLLDALGGAATVVSIDIERRGEPPEHPRVDYWLGSSTDPAVIARARAVAADATRTMVILDSDHARDHVAAELDAYADLVTPGCYLIVEDTLVGGRPVLPDFGPGPMEALEPFLAARDDFVVDPWRERLMLTQNPRGFLRRTR